MRARWFPGSPRTSRVIARMTPVHRINMLRRGGTDATPVLHGQAEPAGTRDDQALVSLRCRNLPDPVAAAGGAGVRENRLRAIANRPAAGERRRRRGRTNELACLRRARSQA